MKVLHVIPSLNPLHGGPMEGLRQLAKTNLLFGIRTEVLCFDRPDASWLSENAFHAHGVGPGFLKYQFHLNATSWLRQNVAHYDAVIINGLWQYHGFATWLVLHRTRVPYFVFPHGMLDPWFKIAYPAKHLKKLLYWLLIERKLLRDARAVFFTCEEERNLARNSFPFYSAREVITGYGTSAPVDDPKESSEAFLIRFPHLREKRILLYMGRIHQKKGCDLLIEAFARVARDSLNLELVICGPGEPKLLSSLMEIAKRNSIASKITWTGMLSGNLKWGAFRSADVLCLPSHQENFGIVVAEALACELPVLISNKVNIWREIASQEAGLVSDDTVDAFEQILLQWLGWSIEERKKRSLSARRCFEQNFCIEATSKAILEQIKNTKN